MNEISDTAFNQTDDFFYSDEEVFERANGLHCGCGVVGCESCDADYYENFPCGKMANGQCLKAGSEDCDFECPNR